MSAPDKVLTDADDVYPDGTVIHRNMTLGGVSVDLAYVKSRGQWYVTAGHPIEWATIELDCLGYRDANHLTIRLPRRAER